MADERRIVVVGATGPTGRGLVDHLDPGGNALRVVSRDAARLADAFPDPRIEKRVGDALDPASIRDAVAGADVVIDCVGLPAAAMDRHPDVARNVAAAAAGTGARCLKVSSWWCWIPIRESPVNEGHPREGGPPWARYRREAEDASRDAGAAIVHLPDFFGPRVGVSTLQSALRDAVAGRPMNWIGKADVKRDYAFVPDAMRVVAELIGKEACSGEDWVVPGCGPITAAELAEMLGELLGRRVKVRAAGPRLLRVVSWFRADLRDFMPLVPAYVRPIRYDGSKLEALLGPVPRTPWREALAETVSALADR